MKYLSICLLIFTISCDQFVKSTDGEYFNEYKGDSKKDIQILFSHNINGETHPCGCRNFPLGGLPQAYGIIKSQEKSAPTLYVDSGDTFFPSPVVADFLLKSSSYTADKIAEALKKQGLAFMTPGDQDFALGVDFLKKLQAKHDLSFLISNAKKNLDLPHKKMIHIKQGDVNLYFIGVLDPSLLNNKVKGLFENPSLAIERAVKEINKLKSKNQRIILLSHSGLEVDKELAKKFQGIDWIIGAHSQSYLRFTTEVGKTQIGQVLSRNHFIGKITIPQTSQKKDQYELIETRDETKDLVKNNPMNSWLTTYKTELDKIQEAEQATIAVSASYDHYPTNISCMECHTKQGEFWQGTAHSISFKTLIDAKASNNTTCVGCHSLGHKEAKGFLIPKKIVISDKEKFDIDKYWNEFNTTLKLPGKSIRALSSEQRRSFAKEWTKLDTKFEVTHNFANVQCLNCHVQTNDHPFDTGNKMKPNYEKACLNCHTADQSPEWYGKDAKGLAATPNKDYINKKIKEVSCPKIEKE